MNKTIGNIPVQESNTSEAKAPARPQPLDPKYFGLVSGGTPVLGWGTAPVTTATAVALRPAEG